MIMKAKERICSDCGKVEMTASKSTVCIECYATRCKIQNIIDEQEFISNYGYEILERLPDTEIGNKRAYTLLTPCGHVWNSRVDNFKKQIKNSMSKNIALPCGTCGPKHRIAACMEGYMEKRGRDYDIEVWKDYMLKVRKLSDATYREFKEEINPNNHPRGLKEWHLDHKIPIIQCFKQGWTPEQASVKENLQMLHYIENIKKSGKIISSV
ncbi:hypothetical protein RsoM2USA_384 [Ralstonia phage RsoM2USA]|nr:hypothetical protein RsoM2USA_384 [Ralstonia phage RsoM2USA]